MKINFVKEKLWLCAPIIIADILDATVTMLGQPAEYWKGSHDLVVEFNPVAHWLLTIHPIGIVIYAILDMAVISTLIILLPLVMSKMLSAFWTIGSANAIYNWLVGPLHLKWWISQWVILLLTIILVYAFEKAPTNQVST